MNLSEPWVARIGNGIEVCDSESVAIAEIWMRGDLEKETAYAHLIAAAPDLLDALVHLDHMSVVSGVELGVALEVAFDVARAAIAKAKGKYAPALPDLPVIEPSQPCPGSPGMSLRDYFAGQALMAIAGPDQWESERHVARWVYKMADAMLEARKQQPITARDGHQSTW